MSLKQVAIALDQLANTLLGGYADETVSAKAWRKKDDFWGWNWVYRVANALFFWQDDHCYDSYQTEVQRRQLPKEYRL